MSYLSSKGGKPPRAFVQQSELGPTRELRQHHEIQQPDISRTARRTAWTIFSRFLALHPDDATISAADRFHADFAIGLEGVRDSKASVRVDCNTRGDGFNDARVDALTSLRQTQQSIGGLAFRLIYWCLIVDQNWTETGKQLGCDYRTAIGYTKKALEALVEHYAEADKGRRTRSG